MAIIVNTNTQSLMVQNSLAKATSGMTTAMQRMSTGLKINSAKDDAAGMAVATNLNVQVRGTQVAQSNAQMGDSMLTTTEGTLDTIQSNLLRIRDLTEQAANGTYDLDAIKTEVSARADEINRIAKATDFNGMKLLDGTTKDLKLQVGTGSTDENTISIDNKIFNAADTSTIGVGNATEIDAAFASASSARTFLDKVDEGIKNITDRKTLIGAAQNRLSSATDGLKVQETNLTSAKSAVEDADIATESSNYVKQQILQQSAASLLVQANQNPSIAVSLV